MFGILANPVAHVRTPTVFNDWFRAHGIDAVLVPIEVPPGKLPALLDGLRAMTNLGGFVVTMPHKTTIVALCDETTRSAQRIGAVNTVRRTPDGRLIGAMFDGDGFVAGLRAEGHEPRGQRAFLAGAGGVARAIAFALVEAGVTRLTIHNRTAAKAVELAERVRAACPGADVASGPADPSGHELVVNGTALGLHAEDALPIDARLLTPEMLVAEVVMLPETTALLEAAAARGCRIHRGQHMLDEQIRLMAAFMGVRSDR
jgi:shikimate dehydrogenase